MPTPETPSHEETKYFTTGLLRLETQSHLQKLKTEVLSDVTPGTIRTLDKSTDEQTLSVLIDPGSKQGDIQFRSHAELDREGWLRKAERIGIEESKHRTMPLPGSFQMRPEHEEGERTGGSGFTTHVGEQEFLCTNAHVLSHAPVLFRRDAVLDETFDIGVIPSKRCVTKPGYRSTDLSAFHDNQIEGRSVRISGVGRYLMEVKGPTYRVSTIEKLKGMPVMGISMGPPRWLSDYFCILIREEDFKNVMSSKGDRSEDDNILSGLSGSAVFDEKTGQVLGVFHMSAGTIMGKERYRLAIFSGPDELRSALVVAKEKARNK